MTTVDHICSVFLRQILLRMKELGVSQTDLAKRMKVSRPYITKVLRQDVNFSFRTAAKLARALQMDFTPELTPNENGMQNVVKNSANTMMKTVGMILMVSLAATAAAMPTQDELSKAGPLIQELMRDDLTAMRNGKKTREQVGDTAAALAREAQSPAEKYLLLTTAFDHYMRGGSYDKANTSLVDLRTAIPDWKHADEYALIEKSLRILAAGKGGPVRERYEALKERQQYAARLKKALAQTKAKPNDKKLQLQVAAYYAVLGYWPQAIDAFIAGSNPACAAAAKLEKESAAPSQVADAWWSASDINPEFLSVAIRAHAADLYKKAIAANSLAGLQKVAAEKRIAEVESATEATSAKPEKSTVASSSSSAAGSAKYYGVELVGVSVKDNKGILSGFANKSYARIKAPFDPKEKAIETVVEFTIGTTVDGAAGILCTVSKYGFAPLIIRSGQVMGILSSTGTSWDISSGVAVGIMVKPQTTYRVKITWDGECYTWFLWENTSWHKLKAMPCSMPVFGGADLQFGTGRALDAPFTGTINVSHCYICIGGKLWWEGVKGAYKSANR